jgi:hypothetical protein
VAVRHPERASFLERLGREGQIELVQADVWDENTVAGAVNQSTSVVKLPFYVPLPDRVSGTGGRIRLPPLAAPGPANDGIRVQPG